MAETRKVQYSFSGGEVSETAFGRQESELWQRGLKLCRNFIPKNSGGIENRPGTRFCEHDHLRWDPFVDDTFGVTTTPFIASSQTNPIVLTSFFVPEPPKTGTIVSIVLSADTGAGTTGELTGRVGVVGKVTGPDFEVIGIDGTGIADHTGIVQLYAPSAPARLVPYEVDDGRGYTLVFGDKSMLVMRDCSFVLNTRIEETLLVNEITYDTVNECLKIDRVIDVFPGDEVHLGPFDNALEANAHGNRRYRVSRDQDSSKLLDTPTVIPGIDTPIVWKTTVNHGALVGDLVCFAGLVPTSGVPPDANREKVCGKVTAVPALDTFEFEILNSGYATPATPRNMPGYWSGDAVLTFYDPSFFRLEQTNVGGGRTGSVNPSTQVLCSALLRFDTRWGAEDLAEIDFSEGDGSVVVALHGIPTYEVRNSLDDDDSRQDDLFTLEEKTYRPSIEPPDGIAASTAGAFRLCAISTVSEETGEESFAREQAIGANAAQVITWEDVLSAFEYNFYTTTANYVTLGFRSLTADQEFQFDNTAGNEAEPDRTDRPPLLANPFLRPWQEKAITAIGTNTVTTAAAERRIGEWVRVQAAKGRTRINGQLQLVEDFTATVTTLEYRDYDVDPAYTTDGVLVQLYGDTPRAVCHFQNRLWFANKQSQADRIYATRSRDSNSMSEGQPIVASDAIEVKISDVRQTAIKFMMPLLDLIVFTNSGAYTLQGDENGTLSPFANTPIPQPAYGIGNVKPAKVGNVGIYAAREGDKIYDLVPVAGGNNRRAYQSFDISAHSLDLFRGHSIREMSAAVSPHPLVWMPRQDGVMLGLTYVPGDMAAWSQHDTQHGSFEGVSVVTETTETASYFSVKRELDGIERRFFERLDENNWVDIQDAWHVDSGLKFDEAFDVEVQETFTNELDLVQTNTFVVGDFFDVEFKVRGRRGSEPGSIDKFRMKVLTSVSQTITFEGDDGTDYSSASLWADVDIFTLLIHRCTQEVSGLLHLVGVEVEILTDGYVNDTQVVDAEGKLSFGALHSRIIAGIGIEAEIQTLPVDAPGGPFQNLHGSRIQTLDDMSIVVDRTLGLEVSVDEFSYTPQSWASGAYGVAIDPVSGRFFLDTDSVWERGQIRIKQTAPLPVSILSLGVKMEVA